MKCAYFSEILFDSIQTAFLKIYKDNARFELELAILVHFRLKSRISTFEL